jgi:hypothetical protein
MHFKGAKEIMRISRGHAFFLEKISVGNDAKVSGLRHSFVRFDFFLINQSRLLHFFLLFSSIYGNEVQLWTIFDCLNSLL